MRFKPFTGFFRRRNFFGSLRSGSIAAACAAVLGVITPTIFSAAEIAVVESARDFLGERVVIVRRRRRRTDHREDIVLRDAQHRKDQRVRFEIAEVDFFFETRVLREPLLRDPHRGEKIGREHIREKDLRREAVEHRGRYELVVVHRDARFSNRSARENERAGAVAHADVDLFPPRPVPETRDTPERPRHLADHVLPGVRPDEVVRDLCFVHQIPRVAVIADGHQNAVAAVLETEDQRLEKWDVGSVIEIDPDGAHGTITNPRGARGQQEPLDISGRFRELTGLKGILNRPSLAAPASPRWRVHV